MPGTEDHQRDTERRFAVLYQAYYRPILAYAVRRAAPGEDAADIVADVFTTAWRRIGELPGPPADRLWLYGVAQRVLPAAAGQPGAGTLTARLRAEFGTRPPGQPAPDRAGRPPRVADLVARYAGGPHAFQPPACAATRSAPANPLGTAVPRRGGPGPRLSVNAVAIRVHRARTRLRQELTGTQPAARGQPATGPASTGAAPETTLTRARMDKLRIWTKADGPRRTCRRHRGLTVAVSRSAAAPAPARTGPPGLVAWRPPGGDGAGRTVALAGAGRPARGGR